MLLMMLVPVEMLLRLLRLLLTTAATAATAGVFNSAVGGNCRDITAATTGGDGTTAITG